LPLVEAVRLDPMVLVYALSVALITSLVFGLAPMLQARRNAPSAALQGSPRTVLGSTGRLTGRRLLVAGQVTLAVVLTVGASLLTRTILALGDTDVGFVTDGSVAAFVSLPPHLYSQPADIVALVDILEDGARRLPGVRSVGVVESLPLALMGSNNLSLQVEGRVVEAVGEAPTALVQGMSPAGIEALGLRLYSGRLLTGDDVTAGRQVALVNRAFVKTNLAGLDPDTTRVRMFDPDRPWLEIVGVVEDFRHDGVVVERDWPQLIVPFQLAHRNAYRVPTSFFLVVHGDAAPETLDRPLRQLIREAAPSAAVLDVRTLDRVKRDAVGPRSMLATLLRFAAGLALVLAGLGLYGVVALWVGQRRSEIGLRMALGATRASVLRLVLRQAGGPVVLGLGVGLVLAIALASALGAILHGVMPLDPLSVVGVTGVLALTACLAAVAPARRAALVEPSSALRTE
jgi:predicted permease